MARGRGRGRKREPEPAVPEVYREMVREAIAGESSAAGRREGERVYKRRKTAGAGAAQPAGDAEDAKRKGPAEEETEDDSAWKDEVDVEVEADSVPQSDDDESDESDVDWEEVDLGAQPSEMSMTTEKAPPPSLELVFDTKVKEQGTAARRKITATERKIRLEIHKLHLLCLVYHVYVRSKWCNDSVVKENLRPLLPDKAFDKLNHDPNDQQFRRHKLFLEGLQGAVDAWKRRFQITRKGLSQPYWKEDLESLNNTLSPSNGDVLKSRASFVSASLTLEGSRDLGAQLFCAFLRSAGVTCRLVCSLQVLPFSFSTKPASSRMNPNTKANTELAGDDSGSAVSSSSSSTLRRLSGLRRPHVAAQKPVPNLLKKPREEKLNESAFPVYWVEAWSVPSQKWIAVDPLATETVGKPSKIEPPMSDVSNTMAYVIAFEEEGQIKDVTRRYAKSYNGKTRRWRLSSTKGGQKWWDRVLRIFQRGYELDRDQVEEAELAQREVSEPIPNNIQDLKDHPLFALKRHLRRNETINPERKVGSITIGTGNSKTTETIFRRQDVKVVRTEQQWYRLGREVKLGEIPLKFAVPRKCYSRKRQAGSEEWAAEEDESDNRMFAEYQTMLYVPPPVEDGLVPKNRFGNLDVYVPTMVPAGGVHVKYNTALAVRAARLLGIDYAEAVTGFDFRNRQAAAVTNGIVVAKEYQDAVEAVLRGFEDEATEEEQRQKSLGALKLWRRFLQRLRIQEHVQDIMGPMDEEPEAGRDGELGGGFMEEGHEGKGGGDDEGGGFVPEDDDAGGGFMPEDQDGDDENIVLPSARVEEEEEEEEEEEIDPDFENEDMDWY